MLSNNGLYLRGDAQYMLLFLVLVGNSNWFRILHSDTLLLQPPVLMRSCFQHSSMNDETQNVLEGRGRGVCLTVD